MNAAVNLSKGGKMEYRFIWIEEENEKVDAYLKASAEFKKNEEEH